MNDPRNTVRDPQTAVNWTPPAAEETGRVRQIIDLHHLDRREYLRHIRGELIQIEKDALGCEITTDSTGEYEAITIECPESGS